MIIDTEAGTVTTQTIDGVPGPGATVLLLKSIIGVSPLVPYIATPHGRRFKLHIWFEYGPPDGLLCTSIPGEDGDAGRASMHALREALLTAWAHARIQAAKP